MKKKWLSSLALALALLLLTGAASAQCQVTISYNKLTAVEGEAIRADYVIDGFEQDKVNLYWRVAMTDRTDVLDPNPRVNYDGVNYWEASVKPESATGSTAVRTVGAGFVQLVAEGANDDVAVSYPQGDGLVRVSGEAYMPIQIAFDREKALIGDTITAYYEIQGSLEEGQHILGAWYWELNGGRTAYEQFELESETGSETLTIPGDLPDGVTGLSFALTLSYAHGYHADFTKLKYSYNVGIWGTSICGGELLDPSQGLPEEAYLKHVVHEEESLLTITFEKGEICGVNGEAFTDRIKAIQRIEEIGAAYGIGRDCNVGDTIIGIKGRVGFEAAAPKLIIEAHRALEKNTLSKWQQYWKDQVANWYGMFLHESQYLEPVMPDIEAMLTSSQRHVSGDVILRLRPLGFEVVGVDSPNDLLKSKLGEYGETQNGWSAEEAKGFIKLMSTPLRVYYGIHPDEKR